MVKANKLSITQAVNFSTGNSINSPGTKLLRNALGAQRFNWRRSETDPYTSTYPFIPTTGSDIVTGVTDSTWPMKHQEISGTGIASDTVVLSKLSATSFQMSKVATGGDGSTVQNDLKIWDPDPADVTTTYHVDVSNSTRLWIRPIWTMLISFSTYEKDCAKVFSGGAGDSWDTYATGSQEGDYVLESGGRLYEFIVPRLGDKVYFNILAYRNHRHHNSYVYVWTGEGMAE